MKKWNDYKKTYREEPNLFDHARCGDLRGLADLLTENHALDLNMTNHSGYSALMLSVYNNEKDFCEALLRCGADANATDSVGNTLLMAAAFKGNLDIFKLLLEFGAEPLVKNKTGMDARDWATMFGRAEIVQYIDESYPSTPSSRLNNILKFIKLTLVLLKTKAQLKIKTRRKTNKTKGASAQPKVR